MSTATITRNPFAIRRSGRTANRESSWAAGAAWAASELAAGRQPDIDGAALVKGDTFADGAAFAALRWDEQ